MDVTSARWRTSSYSGGNGGNCVEVAAHWRKSSHSGGNGGGCVEVAALPDDSCAVRDSKDREGPRLVFTVKEWQAFTARIKAGEFGLS